MKKIIIFLALLIGVIYSCNVIVDGTVKYEVISSSYGFNVTIMKDGNMEQINVAGYKWQTEFKAKSGSMVSVLAQAQNENTEIEAKILFNGELFKKAKSSGDYVLAQANGMLPY